MFAEDEGIDLRRSRFQALGEVAAKTRGIEHGAQAKDTLPGQTAALHGKVRQHIDGITDNDEIGSFLELRLLHLVEDAGEQIDVAVDEVEPAFVGLAAQAGGDNDDVAVGDVAHVARVDALIGDQAGAMQ